MKTIILAALAAVTVASAVQAQTIIRPRTGGGVVIHSPGQPTTICRPRTGGGAICY